MVLMALDHTRDYFGDIRLNPTNIDLTTPALFFTRWITHFCAPVFLFLAGMGAWLRRERGVTQAELSRYLLTRGMWLVLLELTLVTYTWLLTFSLGLLFFQIIAVIGLAMVLLSAVSFFPDRLVLGIGIALCLVPPLLDGVDPESLGWLGSLWPLIHGGQAALPPVFGFRIIAIYSCLPWIGIMAMGFGFAPLMKFPPEKRKRVLIALGIGTTALFVALRWTGSFGEPNAWGKQDSVLMTLVSFLNCTKYPASPLYLLMTLGPAWIVLGLLDRAAGRIGQMLATFGRAPLFYYVLHVLVIHLAARGANWITNGSFLSPMQAAMTGSFPTWFGGSLTTVYVSWILIVAALYLPCAWFARAKRCGRWRILSYL